MPITRRVLKQNPKMSFSGQNHPLTEDVQNSSIKVQYRPPIGVFLLEFHAALSPGSGSKVHCTRFLEITYYALMHTHVRVQLTVWA